MPGVGGLYKPEIQYVYIKLYTCTCTCMHVCLLFISIFMYSCIIYHMYDSREGRLASGGGCVLGGVGVSLVGVGGGDSNTGRSALPGTGFQTPSDSYPTCTCMCKVTYTIIML